MNFSTLRKQLEFSFVVFKQVTIEVTDVNDNSPVFSQLSYEFSVDEDAPVNQVVGVIQASDKDSPANADLTYVIRSIELNEGG